MFDVPMSGIQITADEIAIGREAERGRFIAWLRDPENQATVINVTWAMSNPDVINAMNKIATMFENGMENLR